MIRDIAYTILKIDLPPKVAQAFYNLGDAQRGKPEAAMLKVNHFYHGVACPVFEHGGDLTWRMTHYAKRGEMDFECVFKAERCVKYLSSPYGFEKEVNENIRNNAESNSIPVPEYEEKLRKLMLNYAKEHSLLTVYNKPQWLAREAAVAMGKWQFYTALDYFRQYAKLGQNEKEFITKAYAYAIDPNDEPIPYPASKAGI